MEIIFVMLIWFVIVLDFGVNRVDSKVILWRKLVEICRN